MVDASRTTRTAGGFIAWPVLRKPTGSCNLLCQKYFQPKTVYLFRRASATILYERRAKPWPIETRRRFFRRGSSNRSSGTCPVKPSVFLYEVYKRDSWRTAMAIGMKKTKEYLDSKNIISYVFAMTREMWRKCMNCS